MARLVKSTLIKEWWRIALMESNQLHGLSDDGYKYVNMEGMAQPNKSKVTWKNRIDPDAVWQSFICWVTEEYNIFADQYNKISFMTLFYRLTGAKKSSMTLGDRRIQAIKFDPITIHRKQWEQAIDAPDEY